MNLGLDGKGFLVLGASRGLGRAVAAELVGEGARVLVGARSPGGVEAVASELGEAARGLAIDVADPDVGAVRGAVADHLGGALDGILVNGGGPPPGRALDLSRDDWRRSFDLLLGGPLELLRALAPELRRPASVLWITSSSVRQPIPGLDGSNALRPGVAALVKSLARELAPDVRVNSLAPGRFDTARLRELDTANADAAGISVDEQRERAAQAIPLGRYGDPAELGRVAAFLLSPAASYVNGTAVQVDGGVVSAVP
ncbi:MAG: SDR family oxidoreductase [Thermoleophilaceae bacterium]